MSHAENQTGDLSGPADDPLVRWRPWPCESCGGSATALGFLVRSIGAGPEVRAAGRNEEIDERKRWEAECLLDWVRQCPHTLWTETHLPRLAEGSEHLVLFDEATTEVVKITRPGLYGDYYEIIDGRISQFDNTPTEYLLRMRLWDKLFSTALHPLGITETGQIVSRQRFIRGEPPEQEEVDRFLTEAGLSAVRPSCWLWKKEGDDSLFDVWVGDARADNFVSAQGRIIPIDIRIWRVLSLVRLANV